MQLITNWRENYNLTPTSKSINIDQKPVVQNNMQSKEVIVAPTQTITTEPIIPNEKIAAESSTTKDKVVEIAQANTNTVEIEKYISELKKLYNNAFIKNNAFSSLECNLAEEKRKLYTANQTINQINIELKNLQEKYYILEQKSIKQDSIIAKKNEEITDLSTRLQNAFSVDNIKQNQELISLKNNISNSLKLQYSDYTDLISDEMNEDTYQIYKITLKQVFKTLERFGIDFNN